MHLQAYLRQHPRTVAAVAVAAVVLALYLSRPVKLSATVAAKLAVYPDYERGRFTELLAAFEAQGYTVVVTSTVRPMVAGEPSIHALKRAIDLNVIDHHGKQYTSLTPKEDWEATGLPKIARALHFRWGGDFTMPYRAGGVLHPGYDPIHFDLGYVNG